jgi:hypothetical protein
MNLCWFYYHPVPWNGQNQEFNRKHNIVINLACIFNRSKQK